MTKNAGTPQPQREDPRVERLIAQMEGREPADKETYPEDPNNPLTDVDLELVGAYVEGNVTEGQRNRVEDLLAHNPDALDLAADLWRAQNESVPGQGEEEV